MVPVVVVFFIAPSVALDLLCRASPHIARRLAFVPLGRRVSIVLPERAAALLAPPAEASVSYREVAPRALRLEALPGAAVIEGDYERTLRFLPDAGCVLAHPRSNASRFVRVSLSGGADAIILHACRLPRAELTWSAVFLYLFARGWLFGHWLPWVVIAVGYWIHRSTARERDAASFRAVVDEVKARVAVANGDPPPPKRDPSPTASRFTGPDEWTCACAMVNERRREMCRRCWAQRPEG